MKHSILLAAFLFSIIAFSQTNTFPPSGNVGIGTTSPSQKLEVKGIGHFDKPSSLLPPSPPNLPGVLINPYEGAIELGSTENTYSYIDFKGKNNLTQNYMGKIKYTDGTGFTFHNTRQIGFPFVTMTILNTGLVGIGTQNPDELLTVNGNIHSKEVKVDLAISADYVFQKYYTGFSELNPEYEMPGLEEIESYIKTNHHLPGLPSAKEIQENGLELGKMNNLLLEKIEELTLYIIEQDKRIRALEDKIQNAK